MSRLRSPHTPMLIALAILLAAAGLSPAAAQQSAALTTLDIPFVLAGNETFRHPLHIREAGEIALWTTSELDLVMRVYRDYIPLNFSDDDGEGRNPRLEMAVTPGLYEVEIRGGSTRISGPGVLHIQGMASVLPEPPPVVEPPVEEPVEPPVEEPPVEEPPVLEPPIEPDPNESWTLAITTVPLTVAPQVTVEYALTVAEPGLLEVMTTSSDTLSLSLSVAMRGQLGSPLSMGLGGLPRLRVTVPAGDIVIRVGLHESTVGGTFRLHLQYRPEPQEAEVPWEPGTQREYTSQHFQLISDLHPDFCAQTLERLELVYQSYGEALPGIAEPTYRLRVRLFSTLAAFRQFTREAWGEDGNRTNFVYRHTTEPADRELAGFWKSEEPFWASLQHELFHAYFRATIAYPPQWLNEGLAEYLEAMTITPAGRQANLHLAWIKQLREQVVPEGGRYRFIQLPELLQMTKEAWVAESGAGYPLSWAFVYYLRHVVPDGRSILQRYLTGLEAASSREENNSRAFNVVFGRQSPGRVPLEHMALTFRTWVSNLDFGSGWDLYREALTTSDTEHRIALFERSIAAEPRFHSSRYFLASLLNQAGRHAEALAQAEEALRLFPEYTSAMQQAIVAAAALENMPVLEYWLEQLGIYGARYRERYRDQMMQVRIWRRQNPDAPAYPFNPPPMGRMPR